MSHHAVENVLDGVNAHSLKRRGIYFARALALAAAGFAVLALALVGPGFTASASAQTMGEYGGVTAHSAAAASSMPKVYAPNIPGLANSAAPSDSSSASDSQEVQTYEPPANASADDDKNTDKDNNSSSSDWQQTK
jgi:hypothetical protein